MKTECLLSSSTVTLGTTIYDVNNCGDHGDDKNDDGDDDNDDGGNAFS